MNLLVLTPQLPEPPRQGAALRNFYTICFLARRHRVIVLSFLQPGASLKDAPALRACCQAIYTVPLPPRSRLARLWDFCTSPLPDLAHRLESASFRRTLRDLLQQHRFDMVRAEGLEMATFLTELPNGPDRPQVLLDEHNAEYLLQANVFAADRRIPRRWPVALYSYIQQRRLRRYEASVLARCDRCLVVSKKDQEALQAIAPQTPFQVVPNGVDTRAYQPPLPAVPIDGKGTNSENAASGSAVRPMHQPALGPSPGERFIVFTGTMDFRPNIDGVLWFAQEMWPALHTSNPSLRWYIIGIRPAPAVQELIRLPEVVVTGAVDSVQPYLQQALACIVPLRMGGGTRLKILEAAALGCPVISTTRGAEGLDIHSGEEMLLADTPADFLAAVTRVLTDPVLARRLSEQARALAQRYDWQILLSAHDA